ncbi:tryptophan 2,3-dioxygenase family protein [Actinokineospora sp.]|uniref:tryptophan 2,3-dioxygenase family protein n=1 Tax=Actinokineospora sp. TaxID=1872133 RepID=UPI004037CA00
MTVRPDDLLPGGFVPPQAAGATYGEFLHLDALIAATDPVPDQTDGRVFVTVHQVFELWFRLILHELEAARDNLFAGEVPDALYRLRRTARVDWLLVSQLDALTTISPGSFHDLRPHLGTASGFQSVQFREIEYLSGLPDRHHGTYRPRDPAERDRLARRLREPSVWDAFRDLARGRGVTDLVRLYRSGPVDRELLDVAEALMDHDEGWAMWRMRHAVAVERIIGRKSGTGGSSGVHYLNSRRDERFFPELWAARTHL